MKKKLELSFDSSVSLPANEKMIFKNFERIFQTVIYNYLYKNLKFKSKFVSFSINICGKYKIKKLNLEYRKKNTITDVLSFALEYDLRKNSLENVPALELGDIYICRDVAIKQAREANISLRNEYLHLCIHGFLHLCGYDHERSDFDEEEMFRLEEKIVKLCLKYFTKTKV